MRVRRGPGALSGWRVAEKGTRRGGIASAYPVLPTIILPTRVLRHTFRLLHRVGYRLVYYGLMSDRKKSGNTRRCSRWRKKNRAKWSAYMRDYRSRKAGGLRVVVEVE